VTLIEKIQSEIESLPQEDVQQLRAWFAEKDWLLWDKQLETDAAEGKLDFFARRGNHGKISGYTPESVSASNNTAALETFLWLTLG
jgi:hypothetical protein